MRRQVMFAFCSSDSQSYSRRCSRHCGDETRAPWVVSAAPYSSRPHARWTSCPSARTKSMGGGAGRVAMHGWWFGQGAEADRPTGRGPPLVLRAAARRRAAHTSRAPLALRSSQASTHAFGIRVVSRADGSNFCCTVSFPLHRSADKHKERMALCFVVLLVVRPVVLVNEVLKELL